jgi:hypothetical protein
VKGESDANGVGGANGRGTSRPLFDPVAGMRAMAEIQADGLRAASDLLERMLERADEDVAGRASEDRPMSPDREAAPAPGPPRGREGEYTALVDAWAQLVQRLAGGLARPGEAAPVTVPVDSSTAGPLVRLALGGKGDAQRAVAEVWLHNGTAEESGALALACGALVAPDGTVLDGRLQFDPTEVPALAPRSSRGVIVSLETRRAPRGGVYRGVIQAARAANLWLPVEVTVQPC